MLLKEEASNFLLWDFKNEILKLLAAIWLESSFERLLTNGIHYFNESEQDWNFPLQKGLP